MKITIETIPHKDQRYPTVGDWQWIGPTQDDLIIRVSNMNDPEFEFLVALHEMIEAKLCQIDGVTEQEVDEFDMEFERNRTLDNMEEPGNDPNCPCYQQHFFAECIERLLAQKLGVDWNEYDKIVATLG